MPTAPLVTDAATTGMDPDHSAVMVEVGLDPGDPLGTDVYPEVWTR